MNTRARLWRLLRAEVRHRLRRPARPTPHASYRDPPPPPPPDPETDRLRRAYAALELPYGSDLGAVRAAYRRLMKRYHPDRFQDEGKRQTATEVAKRIGEAYRLLEAHLNKP